MIKILVLFLIALVITALPIVRSTEAYGRIHDRDYGDWVVSDFFDWLRSAIACISMTSVLLVMLIAEITSGGLSAKWENIVIMTCFVLGVFAMLLTMVLQGIARDKMYGRSVVDHDH